MGKNQVYKYSPKSKKRIAALEAKVKGLKEVVTKRNALITELHTKLYSIPTVFYLYASMRDIHAAMTQELYLSDYFILAYANMAPSFTSYMADQILLSVPQSQLTPCSRSSKSCLTRLVKLGYCQKSSIHGQQIYFISTNGKYHLLQATKRIRQIIVACLSANGIADRSIFTERKLRKIYGN